MLERLTEWVDGQLCIVGMKPENESEKILAVAHRLAEYENLEKDPMELQEILNMNPDEQYRILQKAFVLACRLIDDNLSCPAEGDSSVGWLECNGEMEQCGDRSKWECWQKYFMERASTEQVCRVCGCTWENACPGGCYWIEQDLCSECAEKETP